KWLAGCGIPEPGGPFLVSRAGQEEGAIGAEFDRVDGPAMGHGRAEGLSRPCVPTLGSQALACRHDDVAAGTEAGHVDLPFMRHGLAEGLAGLGVPEAGRLVVAPGEYPQAVRAEGN